jgi:ATP phosphoribosyltransferase regulatory subunit HisZ
MLSKYYSLDECKDHELVYGYLERLNNDEKLSFEIVDLDVIKIKDVDLNPREEKDLLKFFNENDVIDYDNFEPVYEDEDDEGEDDEVDDYLDSDDEDDDY